MKCQPYPTTVVVVVPAAVVPTAVVPTAVVPTAVTVAAPAALAAAALPTFPDAATAAPMPTPVTITPPAAADITRVFPLQPVLFTGVHSVVVVGITVAQ